MEKSNRNIKVKPAPKLGDVELIYNARISPVWKLLFTKFGKALLVLSGQFIRAYRGIQAYILSAVKGGKHGVLVSGVCLTLAGSSQLLLYNSSHVWEFFDALFSFSRPDLSVWKGWDWDKVYDMTVVSVKSKAVLAYNIVFVLASTVHTLTNWTGYGTKEISKRGTSYLYLLCRKLFSKWVTVGEFFINFLETVLAIALGIVFIYYQVDMYFGWLLVSIATNELIILVTDKVTQLHIKVLTNI